MYCVVLMVWVAFGVLFWRKAKPGFSLTKALLLLVPCTLISRLALFVVLIGRPDQVGFDDLSERNLPIIIIAHIPDLINFSSYLLIILFWVVVYFQAHARPEKFIKSLVVLYCITNFVVYIFWGIMVALFLIFKEHYKLFHLLLSLYASVLQLLAAICFSIFGTLLWCKLKGIWESTRARVKFKILTLTILCTVLFALRSINVIVDLLATNTPPGDFAQALVALIGFELIPTIAILFILRRKSNRETRRISSLNREANDPLKNINTIPSSEAELIQPY